MAGGLSGQGSGNSLEALVARAKAAGTARGPVRDGQLDRGSALRDGPVESAEQAANPVRRGRLETDGAAEGAHGLVHLLVQAPLAGRADGVVLQHARGAELGPAVAHHLLGEGLVVL